MLTGNLKYLDMLKRYRNGVFHYQATFQHTFTKQMGLLAEEDIGRWLAVLHEEFCRVYWEIVQRAPSPQGFALEVRQSVLALVGWISRHTVAARAQQLREKADFAMGLLANNGDTEGEAGLQLFELARQAADDAAQAELHYQRLKREVIDRALADRAHIGRTEQRSSEEPSAKSKPQ